MKRYKYIIEDARNLEKLYKSKKYKKPNLIITSPPYHDLLNYEDSPNQIGYGQKYDAYLEDLTQIFQTCYEISSKDATFWLISDTFKRKGEVITLPYDLYKNLKEKNDITWKLKDIIIWNKTKNLPWGAKGRFKNQFEYIFLFIKSDDFKFNIDNLRETHNFKKWWLTYPERYNPLGKAPSNIWEFITPIRGWSKGFINHLCPFPYSLVENIIALTTNKNDLVLDPFAGSGSVLAMANVMERNAIGLDISRKYKETFEKEVLDGAINYWEKRSIELDDKKKVSKIYRKLNYNLRRLKVGSSIVQYLNKLNNKNSLFLIIDDKKINNLINLVVFNNGSKTKIDFNDDNINNLIKQAKLDIKVKVYEERSFSKITKNLKIFRYKPEKFYEMVPSTKDFKIIHDPKKNCYFYSNIEVLPEDLKLFKN